jgi:hypothetical protein
MRLTAVWWSSRSRTKTAKLREVLAGPDPHSGTTITQRAMTVRKSRDNQAGHDLHVATGEDRRGPVFRTMTTEPTSAGHRQGVRRLPWVVAKALEEKKNRPDLAFVTSIGHVIWGTTDSS